MSPRSRTPARFAHQFLVVLGGTMPLVWRRIQVREPYMFWDLHVAIQDAMGWTDSHLHEFLVHDRRSGVAVRIGLPDPDEPVRESVLAGWEVPVSAYVGPGSPPALYTYDFGDDWHHIVYYEGTEPARPRTKYPRCLTGAGACPPEDCGGPHLYAELLATLADPGHPEPAQVVAMFPRDFDPDHFDVQDVRFDDPKVRLKRVLGSRG